MWSAVESRRYAVVVMGWQRLVAGRALVGAIIDAVAIANGVEDWPLGYATVLTTGSGVIGYWYARRIERRPRTAVTKWRASLVWVATAPEAPIVVFLWLWLTFVVIATLVMNPSPPWRELRSAVLWCPVLSSTILAQGVVTCSWARWSQVERLRGS